MDPDNHHLQEWCNLDPMVSGEVDRLAARLEAYGLGDEAQIYLLLLENGASTALELSRLSGLARTKVYRLTEKLEARGLVRTDPKAPQKLVAAPYQELERQLVIEERKLQMVRQDMSSLFGDLAQLVSNRASGSQLTFYDDLDGLRQIQENSLVADQVLRIYEKKNMSAFVAYEVAEGYRAEFARRNTGVKQLTNMLKIAPHTDVAKLVALWEPRYLDPAVLPIEFEVIVYNNTVALYDYSSEVFGIEIQSAPLAAMQKQLFDLAWTTAAPMKKVGKRGAAQLA